MQVDPHANTHSHQHEQAVLGPILLGHGGKSIDLWATAAEHVQPGDFFVRNHRLVASVLWDIARQGIEPNAVQFSQACREIAFQRALEAISEPLKTRQALLRDPAIDHGDSLLSVLGRDFISELAGAGSSAGLTDNAKIVAAHARQREMLALLASAQDQLRSPSGAKRVSAIIESLVSESCKVSMPQRFDRGLSECLGAAIDGHDSVQRELHALGQDEARFPLWGIPQLDEHIPLRPGRFIPIGAHPGHGKTSLAMQCAVATTKHLGMNSVLIASAEMGGEDLAIQLACHEVECTRRDFERGTLAASERRQLDALVAKWREHDMRIREPSASTSAKDISAWARQRHQMYGGQVSLLIVDHIHALKRSDRQDENSWVAETTGILRDLARDLRIAVLAPAQFRKEGSGISRKEATEPPTPNDLKGSQAIHADATGVVLIWTKEVREDHNMVELLYAKNRFGPNGSCSAIFKKAQGQVFIERRQSAGKSPSNVAAQGAAVREPSHRISNEPHDDEDVLR